MVFCLVSLITTYISNTTFFAWFLLLKEDVWFQCLFFKLRRIYDINPIQDEVFRGCSRMGRDQKRPPSLKSVRHILQWWKLVQLCLAQTRSKTYMNHVTHPLSSGDISIFSPEISKFCCIKKYRYRFHFDA